MFINKNEKEKKKYNDNIYEYAIKVYAFVHCCLYNVDFNYCFVI